MHISYRYSIFGYIKDCIAWFIIPLYVFHSSVCIPQLLEAEYYYLARILLLLYRIYVPKWLLRKWCYYANHLILFSIFGLRTNGQFKSNNQKLKNVKKQFLLKSAYTLIHKECNLRIFFVKWQCALRCTHFIVLAFTEIYIKDHYANGKCLFASLVCALMLSSFKGRDTKLSKIGHLENWS